MPKTQNSKKQSVKQDVTPKSTEVEAVDSGSALLLGIDLGTNTTVLQAVDHEGVAVDLVKDNVRSVVGFLWWLYLWWL